MSQVYLAEHRGSTNWGDSKSIQHKSNQIKCWFLVRGGKPEYPGKNLSEQSREPTNSTHIWRPILESNPGHIGGQCSHHCADTPALFSVKTDELAAFTKHVKYWHYDENNLACSIFDYDFFVGRGRRNFAQHPNLYSWVWPDETSADKQRSLTKNAPVPRKTRSLKSKN